MVEPVSRQLHCTHRNRNLKMTNHQRKIRFKFATTKRKPGPVEVTVIQTRCMVDSPVVFAQKAQAGPCPNVTCFHHPPSYYYHAWKNFEVEETFVGQITLLTVLCDGRRKRRA